MNTRANIKQLARIEEGVPLWGCTPGSPAALAGLRYGDIVLSVNGNRTRTVNEYIAAKIEDCDHLIVYLRGGELRSTTISPGPSVWPDMTDAMVDVVGAGSFWMRQAADAPTSRN